MDQSMENQSEAIPPPGGLSSNKTTFSKIIVQPDGSDVAILGNTFNYIAQYMFKLTNTYGIGLKNLFYNSTNSLDKYFNA